MLSASRGRRGSIAGVLIALIVLSLVGLFVAAGLYWKYILQEPGEHISREAIEAIISQESPVYYRDGETQVGVFFDREHRIYVPYEEIPRAWVDAITAAEDQRFFEHGGLDMKGFARAMLQNLRAGRLVSGGSTLTMQTAENLYYDGTGDPWSAKAIEVVNTLRLEAHYSKEDILEFYANQFHVSGNGRGIGIAARYFFDKEVGELTVQECAFIAGLVKAPSWYNPFVGSEERRAAARAKALARTNYVLGRMVEEGSLSRADFEALRTQPVPFRRGTFRYDSSVLIDEVQRRLAMEPFPQLFEEAGIENPSTAGIQIITTLDAGAQRAATYGLWHHLSEVGTLLEGQGVRAFFHPEASSSAAGAPPEPMSFHYARITGGDEGGVHLELAGREALLDRQGLERAYAMLAHARAGNTWTRPTEADKRALREALVEGAVLWVSLRPGSDEAPYLVDLEIRPELQGGLIALEDGQIRAMVGGNDNRNFNRAVTAKRQLGSTWKSLVYFAALQLGWTPVDTLDNRRGVFPFEGTWYYPRPDHEPEDFVSLAWAGVRSENLATIWLLYHLTDRLNDEQLRRLAELTGLAPREGESPGDYRVRIRDTHGIIATRDRLEAGLLVRVKDGVIADLAFSGHTGDAVEVRSLHYGLGFAAERKRVARGPDSRRKLEALDHNLGHYEALLGDCQERAEALVSADAAARRRRVIARGEREGSLLEKLSGRPKARRAAAADPADYEGLSYRVEGGGRRRGEVALACGRVPEGYEPVDEALLESLGDRDRPVRGDVWLDGRLHASTVRAIREAIDDRLEDLGGELDFYDPELLYHHPDFRVMLGLRYMAGLARALGVQEDLPPVLSMPLGALDISLEQVATIYQGFLRGEAYTFPGVWLEESALPGLELENELPSPPAPALLIAEIRDRGGRVIYRARPEPVAVADPVSGLLVSDVLRGVVRYGTGRRAAGLLGGWPVGGKTGTTNDFKNAAFVGHLPVSGPGGEPATPWVLAAYVGYDDNRPMAKSGAVLAGASGALPAWIGAIEGLYAEGVIGERPEAPEPPRGFGLVPVAAGTGLPAEGGEAEVLVYGSAEHPLRRFAPFTDRAVEAEAPPEAPPRSADDLEDPSLRPDGPAGRGGSVWDDIE